MEFTFRADPEQPLRFPELPATARRANIPVLPTNRGEVFQACLLSGKLAGQFPVILGVVHPRLMTLDTNWSQADTQEAGI